MLAIDNIRLQIPSCSRFDLRVSGQLVLLVPFYILHSANEFSQCLCHDYSKTYIMLGITIVIIMIIITHKWKKISKTTILRSNINKKLCINET